MRVERAAHARSSRDLVAHRSHGRAVRREQRQRRAAPQQHSDVEPLGQLTEQIAQARGVLIARQAEVGSHVPAGDVDACERAPAIAAAIAGKA